MKRAARAGCCRGRPQGRPLQRLNLLNRAGRDVPAFHSERKLQWVLPMRKVLDEVFVLRLDHRDRTVARNNDLVFGDLNEQLVRSGERLAAQELRRRLPAEDGKLLCRVLQLIVAPVDKRGT